MEDSGAAPIAAVGSSLGETAAAASLAGLPPPPRNAGPPTEAAVAVQDGAGLSQRSIRLSRRASISLRSEEHTSELQSLRHLVCRLLLEKKKLLLRRWFYSYFRGFTFVFCWCSTPV